MSIRDRVLTILEEKGGVSVSGQDMAGALGVSRNAVWKAVAALRQEGYAISSASNRGYALAPGNDLLSAPGIAARLSPAHRGLEIAVFSVLDSTNAEAKRRIAAGLNAPLLIVAGSQTAGRGRLGRSFYSPADTGAYMTLAFPVQTELSSAMRLTCAAAVAVVRAIERGTDSRPLIKWVNDVYLDGRKVCGILTEGVTGLETGLMEHMLIGIGVNLHTVDFPEELTKVATSLGAPALTRNRLIAAIADNLLSIIRSPADRAFMAEYRSHSLVIGKPIVYTRGGASVPALALCVDDDGGLLVRHVDGTEETLRTGEITLRLAP